MKRAAAAVVLAERCSDGAVAGHLVPAPVCQRQPGRLAPATRDTSLSCQPAANASGFLFSAPTLHAAAISTSEIPSERRRGACGVTIANRSVVSRVSLQVGGATRGPNAIVADLMS